MFCIFIKKQKLHLFLERKLLKKESGSTSVSMALGAYTSCRLGSSASQAAIKEIHSTQVLGLQHTTFRRFNLSQLTLCPVLWLPLQQRFVVSLHYPPFQLKPVKKVSFDKEARLDRSHVLYRLSNLQKGVKQLASGNSNLNCLTMTLDFSVRNLTPPR